MRRAALYSRNANPGQGCLGLARGRNNGERNLRGLSRFGRRGYSCMPCLCGELLRSPRTGKRLTCASSWTLNCLPDSRDSLWTRDMRRYLFAMLVCAKLSIPRFGITLQSMNLSSVTKDEDFVHRSLSAKSGPQVLWLRIGNSTNRELIQWLEPIWPNIVAELTAGQGIVEARR